MGGLIHCVHGMISYCPHADSAVSRPTLNNASSVSEDYLQYLSRPHHIEKCFLVDRKKMEKLITGEYLQ